MNKNKALTQIGEREYRLNGYGEAIPRLVRDTVFDFAGRMISNVVGIWNPERALRMDGARMMRQFMTRGYDASKTNRFTKNKAVTDGNANQELLWNQELGKMRKYTREVCRNSPVAKSLKKALSAHIIGTGVMLQAGATDKNGEPLEELNGQVEAYWKAFELQCDITGRKSLTMFLHQAIEQMAEGGEYILNKVSKKNPDEIVDLKLESIENDLLDESYNEDKAKSGEIIIGGIGVDKNGKPLKYYFLKNYDSYSLFSGKTSNDYNVIPAKNIIHTFLEERPGQVRGVPWFHACLNLLQTAGRAVEAELLTMEIQACLSVIYTSGVGTSAAFSGSQGTTKTDDAGNKIDRLAPGMIARIPSADNIQVVDPKRPGNTFAPFIDKILEMCCASLNISYAKGTKDYSKGNFSSQRMGDQDDRRHLAPIQDFIIDSIIRNIYKDFYESLIVLGKIKAPGYYQDKARYLNASFTFQPYDYIQPLQDAQSTSEKLRSGQSTFRDYCTERGTDWRQQLKQMGAERKFAQEAGADIYEYLFQKPDPQTAQVVVNQE